MFQFWWKEHYCIGRYFDEKFSLCFRYCSKTGWQFIKTCTGRKWTHCKDMCRHGCRYCYFPEGWTELPLTLMGKMLFTFHLLQEWVLFSSLKAIKHLLELQLIFEYPLFRAVLLLLLFLMVLTLESLVRRHLCRRLLLSAFTFNSLENQKPSLKTWPFWSQWDMCCWLQRSQDFTACWEDYFFFILLAERKAMQIQSS